MNITVPNGVTTPDLHGYLAVPDGTGPWPGVVVIHEALGLNDDIRSQTDRLARNGYLAVAVDLFSAGGALRCLRRTFATLFSGNGPAFGDIEATREYVAGHPDCTGKVGVIGFCMGGGFALLAAARGFDASAPNYGALPKNAAEVLSGSCPIVGSYGARDLTLRNAARKLDAVLTDAGVEHDVKEYPGVGHSFMNRHPIGPFGPFTRLEKVVGLHHDEAVSEDAWRRITKFFGTHLRD
jgi:carboxymethylenebutenolidase